MCESELQWLDMSINIKKRCCLRIGPRSDSVCSKITCLSGVCLNWVNEIRYLGIYIVNSRVFKCSLEYATRSFYRDANAIFGKVSHVASEEVTLTDMLALCI